MSSLSYEKLLNKLNEPNELYKLYADNIKSAVHVNDFAGDAG